MKSKCQHVTIGTIIVFIGVLLLLHNFQALYLDAQLLWGIAFMVLGGIFIRIYQRSTPRKNPLLLAIFFFIVGLFIILDTFIYMPDNLIVTFFCWIIGAIFIAIYVHNNNQWWAILPGGMFVILGSIVALNAFRLLEGNILWFVLLSGISLIFWFLFLIKDKMNKLGWTIYPAFLLTIFSFFILSLIWNNQIGDVLFPISIIFCGAYFIIKNMWRKKQILRTPGQPNNE